MPMLEQLGSWIVTSGQGLYAWACQSASGVGNFLNSVGTALMGK